MAGARPIGSDAAERTLAVLAHPDNLRRLGAALTTLHAEVIAVPPFDATYLERGHAVHFACGRDVVAGLRVDVMARMRGVPDFPPSGSDAPHSSCATGQGARRWTSTCSPFPTS